MISIKIRGGLGNQLFQYACAYSLAKKNRQKLGVEITSYQAKQWPVYELEKLNIKPDKIINPHYGNTLLERAIINKIRIKNEIGIFSKKYTDVDSPTKYCKEIEKIKKNAYLNGFFQNEKYFEKYKEDLLQQFVPKYDFNNQVSKIIKEIKNENSVAVHIRRGDYIKIGCNIDMKYYDKSIKVALEKIKNPIFYIFSDDIEFCKNYFKKFNENYFRFVDNIENDEYKDLNEFFLMSSCRNQIIANSTFSWWAAWLNSYTNKIVIAPEINMWTTDFYPKTWEIIKIGDRKDE